MAKDETAFPMGPGAFPSGPGAFGSSTPNPFEETAQEMNARHERWRAGVKAPLNRFGKPASRAEIEAAIAEQRKKRGL